MIPNLIHTYQFNLRHIEGLVKDLTDEQMVQQPAGLVNHPMWTLGHLARQQRITWRSRGWVLSRHFHKNGSKPLKRVEYQAETRQPTQRQKMKFWLN